MKMIFSLFQFRGDGKAHRKIVFHLPARSSSVLFRSGPHQLFQHQPSGSSFVIISLLESSSGLSSYAILYV